MLDRSRFPRHPAERFRVTVRGDLMSPALYDGDEVTCCPAEWRRDGFRVDEDYVVALHSGAIMLRSVGPAPSAGHVRLVAWNPAYADAALTVRLTDVAWAARVVVVTRACVASTSRKGVHLG